MRKVTIKIGNQDIELEVTEYIPSERSLGLYGPSVSARVEWKGCDVFMAMCDHFDLWSKVDQLVIAQLENGEEYDPH